MRRTGRRALRGRLLLLVAVLVVASAFVAAAVAVVPHDHVPRRPAKSSAPSTSAPTTSAPTTTAPVLVADGAFQVATTTLLAVDSAVPPGAPSRELPTTVWYPIAPLTGASQVKAPFPLLVFSQGFAQPVQAYAQLIEAWASAGFVVAAPTYPDTAPTSPSLDRSDIVNHPADLKSVVAGLVAAATTNGSVLSGLVDTEQIGLVGQSDGGDVSLAVGANSCCHLTGVRALALLSGAEYTGFGGRYFASSSPPLLVVQGGEDPINPPSCSAQLYDAASSPKYYLDLLGAGHLAAYTTPGSYETIVAQTTTDFFEAKLDGRSAAVSAMTVAGNVAGVATLSEGGAAPPLPPVSTPPPAPTTTPAPAPTAPTRPCPTAP